jgi:LysR family glycine cleavage system transcriptional activator
MLPSLESLRCFVAAARLLNFRRAARSVALTPAAFGQRIKQLEEQLDAPLFRRTTRSVVLTEAGLALLPVAQRCLDAAADCARAARGDGGRAPMEVVLGTRHELGLSWIVPQLDAVASAHPWLQLHLYFGSGSDLMLRVRSMEIDCAVTSSRLADPKLDSVRLHRESYVFVASAALLRQRPLSRAEDAPGHVLLDADASLPLFQYWRDAPGAGDLLRSARFARVVRLGTIEGIRLRVAAGAGVAVLPEYLVREELRTRELERVFPAVTPNHDYFRLVFRADDPRRSAYESLAKVLLERPLT